MSEILQQRHQPDFVLLFSAILLCAVGIVTVFSASTVVDIQSGLPASYFATRQLLFSGLGIVLMLMLSIVPRHVWFRFTVPAMAGNLFLLLLVLIPHIGRSAYGGRRWIGTSSIHLQPSELAIITTAMYLSYFFTTRDHVLDNFKQGLRPALLVTALNFALIFAEPDMGTSLTLLGVSLSVIFASGARIKRLLIVLGAMIPVMIGLALSASYRSNRIQAFLHPFANAKGSAYQVVQGWTAIAAGHWFGRGFDMSIQKTGYLPFPYTDFIFAVFTEEWGFIGATVLLVLFGLFIWRGFWIARHSATRFDALLSVGITCMVGVAAFINLGAVSGLLPVTGIPLPFISYGGTSMIVDLGAVGILLGISRSTLVEVPEAEPLADIIDLSFVHRSNRNKHHRTKERKRQPAFDTSFLTWQEKRKAPKSPIRQFNQGFLKRKR